MKKLCLDLIYQLAVVAASVLASVALASERPCDRILNDASLSVFDSLEAIPKSTTLILAANRLPITVKMENQQIVLGAAPGGLVTALKSTNEPFIWFGWPGYEVDEEDQPSVSEFLQTIDPNLGLKPIFLSNSEKAAYYDEFSNRVVWPVFHGIADASCDPRAGWDPYKAVNLRFAEELMIVIRASATSDANRILVWIQDYHLMLVPKYLRKMLRDENLNSRVRIGFFLHIPFPDQQELARIPSDQRLAILNGMLGADRVGFQTAGYARAFEDAVKGNRLVSEHTSIAPYPIGVNPNALIQVRDSPETQLKIRALKRVFQNYSLMFGVDRLDPIKGLLEKLAGYQEFLQRNPGLRGRTVLLQMAPLSRTEVPEYQRLHEQILKLTAEINSKMAVPGRLPPVMLFERSFDVADLIAYFSVADVVLVNSLRDGMNLVSFESEVAQKGRSCLPH